MTPHEKAHELVSNFRFILSLPGAPLGEDKDRIAKACAQLVCDEIIENEPGIRMVKIMDDTHEEIEWTDYWKQVKSEIEKI